MPFTPSPNIAELQESATIAVSARAKALRAAGRAVIDLGAGEPDFPTPSFIRDAAKRAIDAGATRYTLVEGIQPLRECIAVRANERLGVTSVTSGDVVVSTGSKQSLFNSCFALFGPGDEVLVPTPAWTSYYQILTLARARPVAVYGCRENSLKVTPEELTRAATSRTRGVMLNSPTNPTGAVYSLEELRAILRLAASRGWWVISDEIYREISYEAEAPSLLDAVAGEPSLRERIVVVDGVAKAYAMTGWRIGWSIAPTVVARAICALQSHTTSNASTPSQHAALCALSSREQSEAAIANMVAEFRRRRDAAAAGGGVAKCVVRVFPLFGCVLPDTPSGVRGFRRPERCVLSLHSGASAWQRGRRRRLRPRAPRHAGRRRGSRHGLPDAGVDPRLVRRADGGGARGRAPDRRFDRSLSVY